MHPYIPLGPFVFPAFGLMMLTGVGVGTLILIIQCRIVKTGLLDPFLTGCIAFAGAIAGAYLLRPITRIPELIRNWERVREIPFWDVAGWLFGEMVFYGGLIGGSLAALIFCRYYSISFLRTADLFGAVIPAAHAFGRVGCFLGGCCYGMEVESGHPLAVIYPPRNDGLEAVAAPSGVPLLAVPLIEAAGNLLIAGVVIIFTRLTRDKAVPGRGIALYGLLYSVQRFVLEYFRGDKIRGVYNGVSTSQYISIGIFALSLCILLLPVLRRRTNAA